VVSTRKTQRIEASPVYAFTSAGLNILKAESGRAVARVVLKVFFKKSRREQLITYSPNQGYADYDNQRNLHQHYVNQDQCREARNVGW
jgi:hypothetical protein